MKMLSEILSNQIFDRSIMKMLSESLGYKVFESAFDSSLKLKRTALKYVLGSEARNHIANWHWTLQFTAPLTQDMFSFLQMKHIPNNTYATRKC